MSKIILVVILLLAAVPFAFATDVTVGFENLETICGQQNYANCDPSTAAPYQQLGLTIIGGRIESNTHLPQNNNSYASIFPFGSYYLNIGGGNGGWAGTWFFTNPYNGNTLRTVRSVSFTVLGKSGDVITGARGGVTDDVVVDSAGDPRPLVRSCATASDCPGWLSGLDIWAMNSNLDIVYEKSVDAIGPGEAGYSTSGNDFANVRVNITFAGGFDRLAFLQKPAYDSQGNPLWGIIAIDQITFEEAPVPEPGTLALGGFAVTGLIAWRRRQQQESGA